MTDEVKRCPLPCPARTSNYGDLTATVRQLEGQLAAEGRP